MSKRERCRKVLYRVIGPSGRRGVFSARTVAHAVAQYRRMTGETIRTERGGTYKHTGVEVVA